LFLYVFKHGLGPRWTAKKFRMKKITNKKSCTNFHRFEHELKKMDQPHLCSDWWCKFDIDVFYMKVDMFYMSIGPLNSKHSLGVERNDEQKFFDRIRIQKLKCWFLIFTCFDGTYIWIHEYGSKLYVYYVELSCTNM
jgi:hypothetical protein